MTANPYQHYQKMQITTASTGDLVVLLYDGAVHALLLADAAIQRHEWAEATGELVRAQNIVMELNHGIDLERGGDLAMRLRGLYLYMYRTLVQASVNKDAEQLRGVLRLLEQLRGAWRTVVKGEPAPAGIA